MIVLRRLGICAAVVAALMAAVQGRFAPAAAPIPACWSASTTTR